VGPDGQVRIIKSHSRHVLEVPQAKRERKNAMRTPQEIFDIGAKHLLAQGVKACNEDDSQCAYRGQDGTKCAFGIFIPDEAYSPEIEGLGVETICSAEDRGMSISRREACARVVEAVPELQHQYSRYLFSRLQGVHDGSSPHNWPKWLSNLAAEFCLSAACVTEAAHV